MFFKNKKVRKRTCNVALRRVHVTTVPVEQQKLLNIMSTFMGVFFFT
jgi:hypothetical protein